MKQNKYNKVERTIPLKPPFTGGTLIINKSLSRRDRIRNGTQKRSQKNMEVL